MPDLRDAGKIGSPWLVFKRARLPAATNKVLICSYLIGLNASESLNGNPLGQYQLTTFHKDDTGRLIRHINGRLASPHHEGLLRRNFDANWPSLQQKLAAIAAKMAKPVPAPNPNEVISLAGAAGDGEVQALVHAAFGQIQAGIK